MKDLLITGFGPFPEAPENPSALLAEQLARGFACDHVILPVEWQFVADWCRIHPSRYRRVLHLGVATRRTEPTYELFAHNRVGGSIPGNDGATWPYSHAVGNGAATLGATFLTPSELISLAMPTSYTPGDYLCNFLFYRSLSRARRSRVGFVHVVPLTTLPQDEQLARLTAVVEASEST